MGGVERNVPRGVPTPTQSCCTGPTCTGPAPLPPPLTCLRPRIPPAPPPAGQVYLVLVLVLKWVLVGRMTAEKCRRTDLLWRFNNHLWKQLMVREGAVERARGQLWAAALGSRRQMVSTAPVAAHVSGPLPATPAAHNPIYSPLPLQDLPMYRTSSDPWTGTAAFNTYLRLQGAKVGKQVRPTRSRPARLPACLGCGCRPHAPALPHTHAAILTHHGHPSLPPPQAWLGEKFVCQEPDQLTIGDYVSVCSAVTVVCSTGELPGWRLRCSYCIYQPARVPEHLLLLCSLPAAAASHPCTLLPPPLSVLSAEARSQPVELKNSCAVTNENVLLPGTVVYPEAVLGVYSVGRPGAQVPPHSITQVCKGGWAEGRL